MMLETTSDVFRLIAMHAHIALRSAPQMLAAPNPVKVLEAAGECKKSLDRIIELARQGQQDLKGESTVGERQA